MIKYLLILGIFTSTACSPNLGAHKVVGTLLDSETLQPIRNVEVRLKITEPFLEEVATTNNNGEFDIDYDGDWAPLSELFITDEDLLEKERSLKVTFTHPEFVSDYYEEVRQCKPSNIELFDVGSFYLQKKEEFLTKQVASIE